MKQEEETKITTLCRLVAVYNEILVDKVCNVNEYKISISIAYRIGVSLHVGGGTNKSVYTGDLDGAITVMAVRMCKICNLPRVAVDVLF